MSQQDIAQRIRDMGYGPDLPVTDIGFGVICHALAMHMQAEFATQENTTVISRSEAQEALVGNKNEVDEIPQKMRSEMQDHELRLSTHDATVEESVSTAKGQWEIASTESTITTAMIDIRRQVQIPFVASRRGTRRRRRIQAPPGARQASV